MIIYLFFFFLTNNNVVETPWHFEFVVSLPTANMWKFLIYIVNICQLLILASKYFARKTLLKVLWAANIQGQLFQD